MTETIDATTAASGDGGRKRGGGLGSMLIADLKSMAGGLGISGAGSMKKAQLVDAIKAAQSDRGRSDPGQSDAAPPGAGQSDPAPSGATQSETAQPRTGESASAGASPKRRSRGRATGTEPSGDASVEPRDTQRGGGRAPAEVAQPGPARPEPAQPAADEQDEQGETPIVRTRTRHRSGQKGGQEGGQETGAEQPEQSGRQGGGETRGNQRNQQDRGDQSQQDRGDRSRNDQQDRDQQQRNDRSDRNAANDLNDDPEGGGRNRRRRGRDRDRNRPVGAGGQRNEPDTTILEDDVLVPAAGILDVLDNYAFVRTSGYLPGTDDVYVSLSMVRRFGLRRGDAIVGQVRQPREGERKEKFNPMVRIDAVNGGEPEASKNRVDFAKLTPLHPSERLRLETGPSNLIGRVIDIAAPLGKGQRGLILSPAKAGKTMILQSIANSITTNNPECHLMVVLVDERPEEVTDFERSVNGEVISSTFDRPPADHTGVAELAIERAKRLVELGHDVVVLLDGITRLGRAYNLSAPPGGRVLSGGVDAAALSAPKRFFGAARNIENGGSLTILATALIESGSAMDEVIFEEFEGTGNLEIRLRSDFAEKRLFPAIDAVASGTRREDLLMSQEEVAIVWKLRRMLAGLDGEQALETLLDKLKKSQTNIEFLMQVQKSTPVSG